MTTAICAGMQFLAVAPMGIMLVGVDPARVCALALGTTDGGAPAVLGVPARALAGDDGDARDDDDDGASRWRLVLASLASK